MQRVPLFSLVLQSRISPSVLSEGRTSPRVSSFHILHSSGRWTRYVGLSRILCPPQSPPFYTVHVKFCVRNTLLVLLLRIQRPRISTVDVTSWDTEDLLLKITRWLGTSTPWTDTLGYCYTVVNGYTYPRQSWWFSVLVHPGDIVPYPRKP